MIDPEKTSLSDGASRLKFLICCDPVPLARPRFSNRHVWDSQKLIKLATGITLKNQLGDRPVLTHAFRLNVVFFMRMPQKSQKLEGRPHQIKSDLDNLVKYILDVGNKILYADDCLCAEIYARKQYSTDPRTEFTLEEIIAEKWNE